MLVWELFSSIATIPAISASAAPENENREESAVRFQVLLKDLHHRDRDQLPLLVERKDQPPDTSEISAFTAMEIHFSLPQNWDIVLFQAVIDRFPVHLVAHKIL